MERPRLLYVPRDESRTRFQMGSTAPQPATATLKTDKGFGAKTHLCSPAMAAAAAIAGRFVDVRQMPEAQ